MLNHIKGGMDDGNRTLLKPSLLSRSAIFCCAIWWFLTVTLSVTFTMAMYWNVAGQAIVTPPPPPSPPPPPAPPLTPGGLVKKNQCAGELAPNGCEQISVANCSDKPYFAFYLMQTAEKQHKDVYSPDLGVAFFACESIGLTSGNVNTDPTKPTCFPASSPCTIFPVQAQHIADDTC